MICTELAFSPPLVFARYYSEFDDLFWSEFRVRNSYFPEEIPEATTKCGVSDKSSISW